MNQEIQGLLLTKFKVVQKLGSGSYGHVWRIVDRSDGSSFALKKIPNAFSSKQLARRTYREVMILRQLNHPNIIKLHSVYAASNRRDLYLKLQPMEADLCQLGPVALQEQHRQSIAYQLLLALKYLHSGGLVHRDLKPSNILIDKCCSIKISDFGLARSCFNKNLQLVEMTSNIATRWYRAPQLLFGSSKYSQTVDIWSAGCIIAELYTRTPLFPGVNTLSQLYKILEFTGRPSTKQISELKIGRNFQIPQLKQYSRSNCLARFGKQIESLLLRMLVFSPERRASVDQLLQSKYFRQVRMLIEPVLYKNVILEVEDCIKLDSEVYLKLIQQIAVKKTKLKVRKSIKIHTQNPRLRASHASLSVHQFRTQASKRLRLPKVNSQHRTVSFDRLGCYLANRKHY